MRFYIGNTDYKWYDFLRQINPEDINFWQPSGGNFRAIEQGAPFFLKLKSPYNKIAGVGFFFKHSLLPISIAWEAFGQRNGCQTFQELQHMIQKYRKDKVNTNPSIGCLILNNPVFFDVEDWIDAPHDWSPNIVKGKTYSTDDVTGQRIWRRVEALLENNPAFYSSTVTGQLSLTLDPNVPAYGNPILTKVRIGQGAFHVGVIEAYNRRCSISGEKTLPVLEAAHIKPYSISGEHAVSNGLLLRSDIHKLFDKGYLTITPDYHVEVSARIKEEFENGREYYQHHGKPLLILPNSDVERPNGNNLIWHNANVYKG